MDTQKTAMLLQRNAELEKELAVKNRELEIESALDRVRSRSLSMHNSNELREVVAVVFQKLTELGFALERGAAVVLIFSEESKDHVQWIADFDHSYPMAFKIPYSDGAMVADIFREKENATDFFSKIYPFEEKNNYFKYLFELTDYKLVPEDVKRMLLEIEDYGFSIAFERNSAILIATNTGKLVSEDEKEILKRFARVFEQSYIRFLDLQKAEAQAREAQIELALERVRARTMAMQKSEELPEISFLLFQQVKELGLTAIQNSIAIVNEKAGFVELSTTVQGSHLLHTFNVPIDEPYVMGKAVIAWRAKRKLLTLKFEGQELKKYNEFRNSFLETKVNFPEDQWIVNISFFSKGWLSFSSNKNVSGEITLMLKRFAIVFDQTYTRFFDLQKAEAQAREAKIEAALERVRARTMAMQRSHEHTDAAMVMFQQLRELGVNAFACGFVILDKSETEGEFWMSSEGVFQPPHHIPNMEEPSVRNMYMHWKKNEEFYAEDVGGEALKSHYKYLMALPQAGPNFQGLLDAGIAFPEWQRMYAAYFSHGYLLIITKEQYKEENIFIRFAKVFEQTYTRFLDLQKAEAQAREAMIESALERVRSRTMSMHKSDELQEVSKIIIQQIVLLNFPLFGFGIHICQENEPVSKAWIGDPTKGQVPTVIYEHTHDSLSKLMYKGWKEGESLLVKKVEGEELKEHFEYMMSIIPISSIFETATPPEFIIYYFAYFSHGFFVVAMLSPYEEAQTILKRFAKVFEQTYTRFLDLQKAEAQAREAQIEAALERVRASAMAMHSSEGLLQVTIVLREQIALLGEKELESILIHIYDEEADKFDSWYAYRQPGNQKREIVNGTAVVDWSKTSRGRIDKEKYHGQENDYTIVADYDMLKEWYEYLYEVVPVVVEVNDAGEILVPDVLYYNYSKISGGALVLITNSEASEQSKNLLERAAKVFNLAYSRFLDLKKAERNAKEAQIENSLEKLRSRSLAMRTSEELQQVVAVVFERLKELDMTMDAANINIFTEGSRDADLWIASSGQDYASCFHLPYTNLNIPSEIFTARERGDDFFAKTFSLKEKNEYFNYLFEHSDFRYLPFERKNKMLTAPAYAVSFAFTKKAAISIHNYSGKLFSDEENDILKRFAKVFEQAYIRFLDLQKAEAQAREATRQASLDRVRGQIASMRSTEDLDRITPLVWHELTALGVPFIRCGVFIINEGNAIVHVYLSSPDGHSLAVLNLPFGSNDLTTNAVDHWRKKMVYHQHWNKEEFISWTQSMMQQGQIQNAATYQGAVSPPETLYLHFIPFTQGMLYVGNINPLTQSEIDLVKSLAEAFSIAYARYEDFNKLEKAKESIELTLTELKSAQAQLIQSEKMASLGELTAGIAHEIQNPLNFVNNFSEVNKEMLVEMKDEMYKGNIDDANSIANDIISNEEKINFHGKRADAIVKGMLQHSKKSEGVKEPTDINALCDEYLRLSYHGLRAKDKSFNAEFNTDFDESIGKINIVPQDIGRVLLNLINNAFYAVNERQKNTKESLPAGQAGYQPSVFLSSKKTGDKVILCAKIIS